MKPKYGKILLKLSGEALAGEKRFGLNYDVIGDICFKIKNLVNLGVKVLILKWNILTLKFYVLNNKHLVFC